MIPHPRAALAHRRLTRLAALVLPAAFAVTAEAQETLWLVPESFQASAASPLPLHVERGDGGDSARAPWPAEAMRWLFVRVEGQQENRDRVAPVKPGGDTAALTVPRAGTTLIGLDLRPAVEEIDGAPFASFLEGHVAGGAALAAPLLPGARRDGAAAPPPRVRVRRIESAKALLRVGPIDPSTRPTATAQTKTGQEVELRLFQDPTVLPPGADLPLRTYAGGSAVGHTRVIATNLASGERQEFVTDGKGIGAFRLTRAGPWRVAFHHARRLQGDPRADWELASATVTFEVPEAKGGAR